ncbi:DNA-binding transcriptional LysR family regulator [Pseudomonas sp. F-14 TE3623]
MKLDLNLLITLNALLQEISVTRAAQRIGLSQPACSAALRRLRAHFDDPLLIRAVGHRMQLTPLAYGLRERVSVLIADINKLTTASNVFQPALLEREFTVMLGDAESALLAPRLLQLVRVRAPGVILRLKPPHPSVHWSLTDEMRNVDAAILPSHIVSNTLPSHGLYEDEWSLVSDSIEGVDHPDDVDELLRRPWVLCFDYPPMYWSPARMLEQEGRPLSVAARTDGFADLMRLIAGTNVVGLAPRSFAAAHSSLMGMRCQTPPSQLSHQLPMALTWHPIHNNDVAHRWFRSLIVEAARHTLAEE